MLELTAKPYWLKRELGGSGAYNSGKSEMAREASDRAESGWQARYDRLTPAEKEACDHALEMPDAGP